MLESIYALIALVALALSFGAVLGYAAIRFKTEEDPIVDQIDSILPQTQCGQCGHPGCRPYAEALAKGEAAANLCAPGGAELVTQLRNFVDANTPLSAPEVTHTERAIIREADCIGCALCLPPCPVDAIVGAAGFTHTVVTQQCTGCELCVAACPVDCIAMVPGPTVPETSYQAINSPPCIRCGACNDACPVGLPAQGLLELVQRNEWSLAESLHLERCIECGLCDEACPAGIPLEQHFAAGKRVLDANHLTTRTRLRQKERHQQHTTRLDAQAADQRARRAARLNRQTSWRT